MWGQGNICFLARAQPCNGKVEKKRNSTLSFWIFHCQRYNIKIVLTAIHIVKLSRQGDTQLDEN